MSPLMVCLAGTSHVIKRTRNVLPIQPVVHLEVDSARSLSAMSYLFSQWCACKWIPAPHYEEVVINACLKSSEPPPNVQTPLPPIVVGCFES